MGICEFYSPILIYAVLSRGLKILHAKARKFATKIASRQNSVNQYWGVKFTFIFHLPVGVLVGVLGVLVGVFDVLIGVVVVLIGVLGVLVGILGVLVGVFGVLVGILGVLVGIFLIGMV